MARDYIKRPKKKIPRKQAAKRRSVGPWAWLLTGLLMGLIGASIVYIKIAVRPSAPEKVAKASPAPKAAAPKPVSPKFDFYTLLPEMEVAIPEMPPVAKATAPQPPVLPHPLEEAQYRLQLASYKRHNEADSLKAKLALSGHIVEIHSVKLDNGQVWYRVYTPVISGRDNALALQKELQTQAISSMLLRDK